MEAPRLLVGRLASRVTLVLLAVGLAAAFTNPSLAETNLGAPAAIQPIPFSIDRRLTSSLRPALEAAVRKLSDSRCQAILADFADSSGRHLDENLAATGQVLPAYLGWVLFYDGRASSPCADRQVLAWTTPGSRAVSVCGDQFAALARVHPGDAANILIHETLHTLGLGEGPPDAREITAQVQSRCGR